MRERLHAYTKRTLGAGGSYNDAVRKKCFPSHIWEVNFVHTTNKHKDLTFSIIVDLIDMFRWLFLKENLAQHGSQCMLLTSTMM